MHIVHQGIQVVWWSPVTIWKHIQMKNHSNAHYVGLRIALQLVSLCIWELIPVRKRNPSSVKCVAENLVKISISIVILKIIDYVRAYKNIYLHILEQKPFFTGSQGIMTTYRWETICFSAQSGSPILALLLSENVSTVTNNCLTAVLAILVKCLSNGKGRMSHLNFSFEIQCWYLPECYMYVQICEREGDTWLVNLTPNKN